MERRRRALGILPALVFLFLQGCEKPTIPIGFSGVLTGLYADLGIHARNGARLAVEAINERGGIAGRRLELIVQNDEGSADGAKRALRSLARQEVVAVVGHMLSTQCLEVLPLLQELNLPLISPVASSALLSGKKDLFFRMRQDTDAPARALARYAVARGLWRFAVVYDAKNPSYTEPWVKVFSEAMTSLGGRVLIGEPFSILEDVPWTLSILRILSDDPDGVLIVASATDTARWVRRLSRFKPSARLFGVGWAQTDRLLTEGASPKDLLILATNDPPLEDVPSARDFIQAYRKRFGGKPSFAAARGYDAVKFLAEALEQTRGRRDGLAEALGRPRIFEGVLGPSAMDAFGDAHGESYLVGMREGRFVLVDKL
ncbi:MAG: ABC transporter substrate-binding protein [Desulfosoma sp.]